MVREAEIGSVSAELKAFESRNPEGQIQIVSPIDGIERIYQFHRFARYPFVLSVGTIEPRKNIPFLVQVFERLADFDGTLVLAGMPGWKCGPIFDAIAGSGRADRIRYLRYVPDANFMHLLLREPFAMALPEEVAARLRPAFDAP